MKSFKEITHVGTDIRNAQVVSTHDQIIMKKLLDNINDGLSLEYHLPKEVQALDKPELLKLIYRLLKKVKG